jgi:hypothetical protein
MDIVYIDKWWYEIQELKEVPVWYTSIYWPVSSTGANPSYNVKLEWITKVREKMSV